jgi:hypothetical protein
VRRRLRRLRCLRRLRRAQAVALHVVAVHGAPRRLAVGLRPGLVVLEMWLRRSWAFWVYGILIYIYVLYIIYIYIYIFNNNVKYVRRYNIDLFDV